MKLVITDTAGAEHDLDSVVLGIAGDIHRLNQRLMRVEKDEEGKPQRALMCDSDGLWSAKDRSGKLDPWEMADLSYIINKIAGKTNAKSV